MSATPFDQSLVLIGQYDSPFVRRIGITLRSYGVAYEHRPWSVWGDAERIAKYNPLRRVPTLVLGDGSVLVDTFAIIDAIDEAVGASKALLPASGPERQAGLRIAALASGFADKAVSLLYEPLFHAAPSQPWMDRCARQIKDTLATLEADRAARSTPYWLGATLSHADVAFACAFRFCSEAHPRLLEGVGYPALEAQAERCEALANFAAVYQPIVNKV